MKVTAEIRKYSGGGIGDLGDSNIPKAQVEIYLRSQEGEIFYVPTLAEGIVHLLSKQGYRLGIYHWPAGAGFDKPRYDLVVYRDGDELEVEVRAPGLALFDLSSGVPKRTTGKIIWEKDEIPLSLPRFPTDTAHPGIEVVSLEEALGLSSLLSPKPEDLFETETVEIGPER